MPSENNFSPEIIRPYPKAAAGTKNNTKNSQIGYFNRYPQKNALALEQSKIIESKSGQTSKGGKTTRKKNQQGTTSRGKKTTKETGKLSVKRKVLHDTDEENVEDDYFCLICCDPFDPKKSGEEWIVCVICKKWSHVKCVRGVHLFELRKCKVFL
ncbi:hypothetical protein HHI36_022886 [Cryptolaemus montrouzieri]|uniref:Zinc finger PHD-type domain-containing protein n=1 Tax=Cryptolaemus montrouzieri TaxID=559131 RepID=A0ABD2PFP1_9CUCU